ncbi:hypothetical protein P4U43_11160 [Arthrobacter sp. EH-1B-1]|uniref:DUF4232 domain-containing protein n=1 Tax=Arthrobacter vasquezii TaxID=2977629 RepID=A0ABT6CWD9_9MICC|nr:hypothetical protein [Arthrobacter vasquezii]MDF9278348.1 hypothetical protein [Arthrobacter vasquezii]
MSSAGGTGSSRVNGPRRTPSPQVYKRRRQVVALLALLLVGGLIWAGIALAGLFRSEPGPAPAAAAPTSAAANPTASATPSSSPSPTESSPTPTPTPTEPVCNPASIEVTGSVDAETYAPDQNPVLSLTVSNTGEVPCPVNVGTSQMEFLITSGEDRIFSSRDCQEGAEDLEVIIEPGKSETARFTWERIRSAPECATVDAVPGAGQYAFRTRLGERTSDEVLFTLE